MSGELPRIERRRGGTLPELSAAAASDCRSGRPSQVKPIRVSRFPTASRGRLEAARSTVLAKY